VRWPGRPSGSVSVTDNSTLEMCIHVMRYTDRRLYFYLFFAPDPTLFLQRSSKPLAGFGGSRLATGRQWKRGLAEERNREEGGGNGEQERGQGD